ncbi:MAG: SDR family NAD(P)-dependent oxidoreductase [bacterium]|nr:SDR family NAD(P)-dependent oxidoreductase [bacterium]
MTTSTLHGRTALVTGGTKGIGRAIADALTSAGARVWVTARTMPAVSTSAVIVCDAVDPAAIAALADHLGGECASLDILVNNVGDAVRRSSFTASDDTLWRAALDTNLLSTVRTTHALLSLLTASTHAVIVNVSSIAARTGGSGDSLHYAVAKAGVDAFTIGLAKELGPRGVRVVGVAPSVIATDFQARHSTADRTDRIIAQTPLGRVGTPDDVASVVAFLASDAARYISGETVLVSGGRR